MVNQKLRRKAQVWIIGILVFIMAMAITFSDVYGLSRFEFASPGNGPEHNNPPATEVALPYLQNSHNLSQGDDFDTTLPSSSEPPAVPEPTTLALLALGCGALLAVKRKLNP
jgi:hypothetical protein